MTLKLAQVEVELSDVSLGFSHPKYITRQEEILKQHRQTLDEVKEYLQSNTHEDEPHIRTGGINKYFSSIYHVNLKKNFGQKTVIFLHILENI